MSAAPSGLISTGGGVTLIGTGFALRPGLEALVHPEILLRHLAHALLDEGVHASHVGSEIIAGKILPFRVEPYFVAFSARKLTRDAWHDHCPGDRGNAAQRGDGGRLDSEKWSEQCVPLTQIH